jgi:predicted ester cyclase
LVYKAHMPDPNATADQPPAQASIRARLARRFEPAELREIKRTWVRHSIAEDARDIDGLLATLTADALYEIVPTGQRWQGLDGVRAFYSELFGAFPDNRFALTEIVVGPQGVFEAARLTGTNLGPWAGASPSGLPVNLEVLILFPWDAAEKRFKGERIWFDRGSLAAR